MCRHCLCVLFFFKQKTAYEMRISDCSSDVCSSDLAGSYRVVLTKADKIKPTELAMVAQATAEETRKRPAAHPDIIATSSETGLGIAELRAAVIEALG